jgi:hypothetical protein
MITAAGFFMDNSVRLKLMASPDKNLQKVIQVHAYFDLRYNLYNLYYCFYSRAKYPFHEMHKLLNIFGV